MKMIIGLTIASCFLFFACEKCVDCQLIEYCTECDVVINTSTSFTLCMGTPDHVDRTAFKTWCNNEGGNYTDYVNIANSRTECSKNKDDRNAFKAYWEVYSYTCKIE